MSANLKTRQRCSHCKQFVYRFLCGNVVDYSHNPNKLGAVPCRPSK